MPRPEFWGQGRGQFLDVEAKAEAKEKVKNKKYQNDGWQHTGKFISLWSTWHSLFLILSCTVTNFYHTVMSCSRWSANRLVSRSLLGCWFFCCRLRPGRGEMFEAEAKALRPRPRPRPKLWPRGINISVELQCLIGRWAFWCIIFAAHSFHMYQSTNLALFSICTVTLLCSSVFILFSCCCK